MPRYEFSEGTSNKFWEIKLDGKSFTTTYGKIGSNGQTTLKKFAMEGAAKAEYDKLIAEKVKKGYKLVGGKTAQPAKSTKAAPVAAKTASKSASAASASGTPGAKYYEFVEGSSSKFWEIVVDGNSVKTRYGKIGSGGQQTVKDFGSRADAMKEHDRLVAEKTRKGYVAKGGGGATAAAPATTSNPELEKAIDANPYDEDAYSVYADWLQDQGDPRGELIALFLGKKDKQAKALIQKQKAYFLGPLAEHQQTYDGEDTDAFTWKYGFIHALRLSHDHYANDEWKGRLVDVLDEVLRHPSGRFLTEITFVFNNDPNESTLQPLIDLLAKRAPKTIRKLFFGDYQYCGPFGPTATGNTEISWYSIGKLGKLWKAVPKLQTLIVQGGSSVSAMGPGFELGTLELPEAERIEIRTGGLEKKNVNAIHSAKLPKIEHLEIWYGDDNYGGNGTAKDVAALLARTDLPKLRTLGLRNAMFTDDLPELLAKSRLVRQLSTLDLSMGCLTDAGAELLAKHKDAFAHLDTLDVSENYLTKKGVAALKGVAKKVIAKEQREQDDPEDRYPVVGE
ncbi:MAG TPA: WGR domain-containing protein [Kofleriaceae bacterium]|nr:WGR domain-containing protein [Kofleriaceae bacterium]